MDLLIKHRILEEMSDDEFLQLCAQNRDLRFERNADGNIIVMSPASSISGSQNSEIDYQLQKWNKEKKLGKCFDSSAGFKLRSGAVRSPDASFIFLERWNALTQEQKRGFAQICPDFAIELLSESDSIQQTELKVQEYLSSGCQLAWIIDPDQEIVLVFKAGEKVIKIEGFDQPLPADILPGFSLDLRELKML